MMKVGAVIVGILMIWLVIGLLLTPVVRNIMVDWGTFVRGPSPEDINVGSALFTIVLVSIVVVVFAGRVKGVLNRFIASIFLIFHSFPTIAWFLEPSALYVMVVPVGLFALLCSPLNPLFVFPPARQLLRAVAFDQRTGKYAYPAGFGFFLILIGLGVFIISLIQLLRGRRLVTSGLYSIVRHPQYLGIILATLGFTFQQVDVRWLSLVTWIILVFAYVWLARREENSLQEKYKEEFLAYKRRVSFILPLPTRSRGKQEKKRN